MNATCLEEKKTRTILFVDDDPEVLTALRRALREEPYRVVTAEGATEALDWLNSHPADLIVADERMPEMSGCDLLGRVRRSQPLVGRILLTGYPGPAVMIRSLEAGVDFLMTKPWNSESLRRMIRCLLHEVAKGRGAESEGSGDSWRDVGGEG